MSRLRNLRLNTMNLPREDPPRRPFSASSFDNGVGDVTDVGADLGLADGAAETPC
jgi:hypothetical protein